MFKTIRNNFDRHELRRDRRYALPPITVTLASGAYATGNWSLGGFLLSRDLGLCIGTTLAGQLTLPSGAASFPVSVQVVRRELDGTGFRFVDPSPELVGALDRAIAGRLFRKRA